MQRRTLLQMALAYSGTSVLYPAMARDKSKTAWSVRMADSDIKRNPEAWMLDFAKKPFWGYCQGLVCLSLQKLWEYNGDIKYYEYVKKYADDLILADGTITTYDKEKYNIDAVNSGKILFAIYEKTKEAKYKKALDTLRDQMRSHPRTTEGGFWHKKHYQHQMWLDGLYMATPFLAQYAKVFQEPTLFDDVAKQILLIDRHNKNQVTGLYSHGWDESKQEKWADKETGKSAHTWGRGMGWYAMTLVDTLEFFPKNHPQYKAILAITHQVAKTLQKYQDTSTGLWYQVMDVGAKEGNYVEASASTMFVYTLMKGIRLGVIDKKYLSIAQKGYQGILKHFIKEQPDGGITIAETCAGAGLGGNPYRDGTYEYYCKEAKRDNDPKAVGPFILLAIEFEKRS
ncbi:glycoside hydrolase family 105 protein [Cellulophaga sp. BC115SP]|uniref:glycoside hydrolase family 88/105 protein n=1 Tax=Cellulophaga sp. BC115SP TaxID=2683263 RepID=UPI0014123FD2|nr:glycoside hydrolase family 88 protein [Cellulophaga sp. BC115SP]NBB28567.1 glycosyl hydrolase family 88 [Cellulophaga sp. BC115SP]